MRKRSSYRPRPVMLNPLASMRPVSAARRDAVMAQFWLALSNMVSGTNPGVDDWRDLSDCLNTIETMALGMHKLRPDEVMPDINAAIGGMVRAKDRYQAGKGMRLDAEGIIAIRTVIDYYGQCLEGFTEREMSMAQAETQARVNALLNGPRKAGQVVIEL